jgi:serine/threonine protein kinase
LARSLTGVYRAIKVVYRDRFSEAGPFEREFNGLKRFTTMVLPESGQLALLHVGENAAAGFFYYVMELADDVNTGREVNPARYHPLTLREVLLRGGRIPSDQCLAIGVELARALAGLHSCGLVHRDIKPSNVIMVAGSPKLADIGLVASSSDARTFVGTEGYVPPEGPGRPSADVFALGKLLYELATGFDRNEFPKLGTDLQGLPDRRIIFELNEVILRACDPLEARRYGDGSAVLADLLELKAGHSLRRRRSRSQARNWAAVLLVVLAVAAAAGWWAKRRPLPAAAVPTTSQQLIAKAWELVNSLQVEPEDLAFAESLCKQASELDPTNPDVWAARSIVDSWFEGYRFDQSSARLNAARSDTARALTLAPASYEARLAQAYFLVFCDPTPWNRVRPGGPPSTYAPEAQRILEQLLRERPNEPRALRALSVLQGRLGHTGQVREIAIALSRDPHYAALGWLKLAYLSQAADDKPGFEKALDRSLAIQPFAGNLSCELQNLVEWKGDLDAAGALIKTFPTSLMISDSLEPDIYTYYYYRRDPERALNYLHGIPREWNFAADGPAPLAYDTGEMQRLAGRTDVARAEWQHALKLVEVRLLDQPTNRHVLAIKTRLLIFLGEFAEAETNMHLGEEVGDYHDWVGVFYLRLAQGRLDAAMDIFDQHLAKSVFPEAAVLRLDPRFDPLRNNARFKAELAKAEADPDRSPNAPKNPQVATTQR